tara:strand:- start:24 stop:128 length:105 start_codon:yes stop_codon:yes gene_type:complete
LLAASGAGNPPHSDEKDLTVPPALRKEKRKKEKS